MNKTTNNPSKKLKVLLKKHSGRDNTGSISVRHQGGRQKRFYRIIDFKRDNVDVAGVIETIEYDPNRTANIALVRFDDGQVRYILHCVGMEKGMKVIRSEQADIKPGNALTLHSIPLGVEIHNLEMYPGNGGQIVKSAGSAATIIAKDGDYADVKLPSREVRKFLLRCTATIGRISNVEHKLEEIGSAGRKRHMGIRPTVRGVAQNPSSHPHGGGEGRTGTGSHPKTRQGKPAMGKKTRKVRWSDSLIVKNRRQAKVR